MNHLHVYPTSRALRSISEQHRQRDMLLPTLMRMDAFESRVVLVEERVYIDSLKRILLLQEAARFDDFTQMHFDLNLVKFFTRSDALFKFFEEMSAEAIDFSDLAEADAYVEFEKHLEILQHLLDNYETLLDKYGFTDKAFLQKHARLNTRFLQRFEQIEIHLEGYLSHYELELLNDCAKLTTLIIHYHSSRFNQKMIERFEGYGITLPMNAYVVFDFTSKKICSTIPNTQSIHAEVYVVEQRQEQIALAFVEIEKMVASGLSPEEIVLILPDEKLKEQFSLYDSHKNLNFAMGYDYSNGRMYKRIEAVYLYWQSFDSQLLKRYGYPLEKLQSIAINKPISVSDFFDILEDLELLDAVHTVEKAQTNERVQESYVDFSLVFTQEQIPAKEWLYLWLQKLAKITLDDVRGGKITVMGVLETRGISYKGVVIVDFNEGVVPATSSKDQFLNSSVRAFAKLPTKHDRESLQKQYYKRLLEQAEKAVIFYSSDQSKLPSKFLYELGLNEAIAVTAPLEVLYDAKPLMHEKSDPIVEDFDAFAITWSASRLKTYLECKRKYYYRYIQKLEAKQDESLNEGQFLHTLLEELHKESDHYTQSQSMSKALHQKMDMLLPSTKSKESYQKLLWKEKLKGYVERQISHFNAGWRVIAKEAEVTGTIGGLKFKGRIDRIDQNDAQTLVLDYKSGSTKEANKSKNLETLNDFQMSIYTHLLEGKYQNVQLAFLKIFEGGEIEEITVLEEKNALLSEHIIALKQSKRLEATRCEKTQTCQYCAFTLLCERGEYL